jgi:hypothetical protein
MLHQAEQRTRGGSAPYRNKWVSLFRAMLQTPIDPVYEEKFDQAVPVSGDTAKFNFRAKVPVHLRLEWEDTLHRFVRNVVAPLLQCHPDRLGYQSVPTFRISPPKKEAIGVPHRDFDYYHQPAEINIWIPLTKVFGNNTLYTESAPECGDYHPFILELGQAVSFWGNQCRHYTVPNDTDWTRVSFDIRVVDLDHFDYNYHDQRGKPSFHKLGEYYHLSSQNRRLIREQYI